MSYDANLEFSMQSGSEKARELVYSHFRMLKKTESLYTLPNFPFKCMSIILRVDGEHAQYNLSGIGWLDIDAPDYVSVDLGMQMKDYSDDVPKTSEFIATSLRQVADFMISENNPKLNGIDFGELDAVMNKVADAYLDNVVAMTAN